jgi:hypothetical protein
MRSYALRRGPAGPCADHDGPKLAPALRVRRRPCPFRAGRGGLICAPTSARGRARGVDPMALSTDMAADENQDDGECHSRTRSLLDPDCPRRCGSPGYRAATPNAVWPSASPATPARGAQHPGGVAVGWAASGSGSRCRPPEVPGRRGRRPRGQPHHGGLAAARDTVGRCPWWASGPGRASLQRTGCHGTGTRAKSRAVAMLGTAVMSRTGWELPDVRRLPWTTESGRGESMLMTGTVQRR